MSDTPQDNAAARESVSVAITGSGGAGVITAGEMLLAAAAHAGWHGIQTRSVGPQIRGGEAVSMVRLATFPVEAHDDAFHLLVAVDWRNFDRFAAEVLLAQGGLVIMDEAAGDVPPPLKERAGKILSLPLSKAAKEAGSRVNMVALGCIAALLGIPESSLEHAARRRFAAKGEKLVEASLAGLRAGRDLAMQDDLADHIASLRLDRPEKPEKPRWIVSGNQMAGLGAVHAGVRFVAAYPITPASDLLEWMTPVLSAEGGMLVQAEDELASINMIIGSSFGGVPSMTATSGPGLALMMEGLGLAVSAEIPVVVVNVQRGGPSTGIPTKSEQTDLNIALCGMHGEAPHLVLAPLSAADCLFTTAWAVELAEALQAPAIVLSDQKIAQMKAISDPLPLPAVKVARKVSEACAPHAYKRYALTEDGVSPMALPGTPGCMYTADGLEHGENAVPSSRAEDHAAMLEKRARKLRNHDYGPAWAEVNGEGEIAVICWGSTAGPVHEAARVLAREGISIRTVSMRLLSPLPIEALEETLSGVKTLIVAENSHSGQFLHYLRAWCDLPQEVISLKHAGPRPITAPEVRRAVIDAIGGGRMQESNIALKEAPVS